ncbi:MAG: hypothetical protein ABJC74_15960 [Gemmatimonadota bacterium]
MRRAIALAIIALSSCQSRPEAAKPPATDVPVVAPQPARIGFAISFPRPGDTLVEGHTYVIRWLAPDTFRINLGAAMGGHDKGLLLHDVPAHQDSLVWNIPVGYVTGFGPASSDAMRLRLENARNPDQWTEVGPFTITGGKQ